MSVFLDTRYFIAYANDRDPRHMQALELAEQLKTFQFGHAFTSVYVADEAITYTLQKENHGKAVLMGEKIFDSDIIALEVPKNIFEEAWRIFKERKGMSFTDCTTVALMRENKIRNLATFDGGFRQFREIHVLE